MTEIKSLVDFLQAGGLVAVLAILAFPILRKKFGFQNGDSTHNEEHDKMWTAIEEIKTNHLSHIQNGINEVKTDVAWIKGRLEK